jgi:hypothetical protein
MFSGCVDVEGGVSVQDKNKAKAECVEIILYTVFMTLLFTKEPEFSINQYSTCAI